MQNICWFIPLGCGVHLLSSSRFHSRRIQLSELLHRFVMSRNIPTTFWLFLIKWIILITKGFLFRFLAHEIEEENFLIEELVVEWETKQIQNNEEYTPMHRLRYELFVRMDYRALVSRKVCEEVMITKSKLSAI